MNLTLQLFVKLLFLAFLYIHPHIPANRSVCIDRNYEIITNSMAKAYVGWQVPPSIFMSVTFAESVWGCDPHSGGSWGSPINRTHRGTPGGPMRTAEDLHNSYVVCHNWRDAVSRYRYGLCRVSRARELGYTPGWAMGHSRRLLSVSTMEVENIGTITVADDRRPWDM